jgi:hypothetical protein
MRTIGLLFVVCLPLAAQQPRVSNAKLTSHPADANFASQFDALSKQQGDPAWFGYAQPAAGGSNSSCCFHGSDSGSWRGCGLEGRPAASARTTEPAPVLLEGSSQIAVLFRASQGAVEKIRTYSLDCDLDAGGLPFHWFSSVPAAQSLALLSSFVSGTESEDKERRRLSESAVTAIALHSGDAAGALLEKYAAAGQPESQRRNAIFWLGGARGARGFEVVNRIAREDASDRIREHAIFALTQSPEPRAIDSIIQIARDDKSPHVRGQALFWLSQKAGNKAAGAITSAIENDPETAVKERAVFALSQLPKDQGVPLLIEQARKNRNPAVRKKAIFWLGQSKDPRALTFFEEILVK